ncbi:unnamed protein product [Brassicogethes aeneus]|uniref:Protein-tyrosine sulfotransferase n=1 Tax=Brassicogethes aeneus TaxID=1431903 RepID=A0A9P0B4V8_BRAAE|nr:unnamed protein product [Brassicogethes aeneus]
MTFIRLLVRVACGQETRVIPRLLQLRFHWLKSEKESLRLEQAGITKNVLDAAIAAFTLEIIAKHGEPAPRLCNKDPLTIKMGTYVIDLFPNAKFIFMVRDGRATAHSIITRKVTITGFDLTSYRQCMKKWNGAVEAMNNQCRELGSTRCLRVPYEQLVLHPKEWMEKVLKFLDLDWDDAVLHHEDFINNGISLSKVERSSDQVIKPVNLEALTKWVGNIPEDVVRDMADIAPMLSVLGYDPYANPPNYGHPDDHVARKTNEILKNKTVWEKKAKEMFDGWDMHLGGDTNLDKEPSDNPNNTTIFHEVHTQHPFGDRIIGSFFLPKNLNEATYLDLLESAIKPALIEIMENHEENPIFQQEGAPPHYALSVRQFLDKTFPGR